MKKRKGDFVVLLGLVVLGFILGRFQTVTRTNGHTDPLSRMARWVVEPTSGLIRSVADEASGFLGAVGQGQRLASANARLRAIAQNAESYQADIDRLQAEIDELRKLGGWESSGARDKVPADVIGYFPLESRITLNVGSNQGVGRGMPVATYEGLVGRVETVDKGTSQVLLMTSPSSGSRISAVIRARDAAGLIRGEGSGLISFEIEDPKATAAVGDIVTTSGFSEFIPRGIVIGQIVEVNDDKAFGNRVATIRPAASIFQIREVLVIK